MENVYTPDLNMVWDDEEFVPSTQLYNRPHSPNLCDGGSSSKGILDTMHSPSPSHDSLTSEKLPTVVRTPLASITNQIPGQRGEGKNKIKVPRKARKPSTTSHGAQAQPEAMQPTSVCTPKVMQSTPSNKKPSGDQPISPKLFFRSGNWTLKETVTLMDARAKLIEEMKDGNLAAIFKTQDERWEFISQYCVQRGVLRSADQCLFRWDRISSAFKKINDYERHIPSGCDGYWAMNPNQRQEMKLPRNFTEDIYTAMLDRMGTDRLVNPGNIVYDTSTDMLGDDSTSPNKATDPTKKEDELIMEGESSSGKKRKRGDKMSILKKELEGTTKQLLTFMEGIDTRRAKHDDDVIELTKSEFEEAVALNRKRLVLEEESNKALKQIARAFECFAVHASSCSKENNVM